MKNIKTYKIFEASNSNIDGCVALKDIASKSYIIQDEGYEIVYFVVLWQEDHDTYTYAIGSSLDDIILKADNLRGERVKTIFLEIVSELPRHVFSDIMLKNLEKNNLFDYILDSFKLLLPEYKITKSSKGPYIYFEL